MKSQRDEDWNGPIDYPHKVNELDDFKDSEYGEGCPECKCSSNCDQHCKFIKGGKPTHSCHHSTTKDNLIEEAVKIFDTEYAQRGSVSAMQAMRRSAETGCNAYLDDPVKLENPNRPK